ncbi:MAG: hypothetical protein HC941_25125 [Microcoleus sp. SU_5_3]|nr:hypothetical protein [Microcoleus sp. SU_5_3]
MPVFTLSYQQLEPMQNPMLNGTAYNPKFPPKNHRAIAPLFTLLLPNRQSPSSMQLLN